MLFYFVIFTISFLFALFAEKSYKKKNMKLFFILSVIAISIPAIIAGFRSSGVGTDTRIYVDWVFRISSKSNSILDVLNYFSVSQIEPFYCLFNYAISRVSTNLTLLYFLMEFVILSLIYFGCYNYCKNNNASFSIAYFLFLILFFNKTLNLCRQSIAMAICFYNFKFIKEEKPLKFLTLVFVAILFHNSAFIFLPMYLLYKLHVGNSRIGKVIIICSIVLVALVALTSTSILNLFSSLGIIGSRYSSYLAKYGNRSNIKIIEIIGEFLILFSILFFAPKNKSTSKESSFLIILLAFSIALFLFGVNITYLQRISYFFQYFIVLYVSNIISRFKYSNTKVAASILIILVALAFSYLYYGVYLFDETVPYVYSPYEAKNIK